MVTCADVFAGECFSGISEAVHDVGKESEQLHQKRVYSQYHISVGCSPRCKEYGDGYQTERAQEDIPVYPKEAAHGFPFK